MKSSCLRTTLATACAGTAIALAGTAAGQSTNSFTLQPDTPAIQGASPLGVYGDSPSGWGDGSWQAAVTSSTPAFTSIILPPTDLFGRTITVDELASITYLTKKDTAGTQPHNWFMQFYTEPYSGSPGSSWYGNRINAEPYFSENINAPADQWNKWTTEAGQDNRLRFFDSSTGYFGSYTDGFLDDLIATTYPAPEFNVPNSGPDLGGQEIQHFSIGLGTGWAEGFEGQIDGIRIELTDGSVAEINLEAPDPAALELVADESCYDAGVGDTVTVNVELTGDGLNEIVGGQFFLSYDASALQFVSADPGSSPFDDEMYEFQAAGIIDYAVITGNQGESGTDGDATMAVLTFETLAEVCDASSLVEFRPNVPPTTLTDNFGSPVMHDLADLGEITIDGTAPTLNMPSNVTIECDDSSDPTDVGEATASDNCDADPDVTYDDAIVAGSCPQSYTIERTWTATDSCGNSTSDLQTITVQDTTAPELVVGDDIQVYADAGYCSAMVDIYGTETESFDENPDFATWIVDRAEPACFQSTSFGGDNRLHLCIDAGDATGDSGFYNTQGRKIDPLPSTTITSMQVDMYIPSDWATSDRRMAGFWLVGNEGAFPILEFTSGTQGYESTTDDPANSGTPDPRFRGWASSVGWMDMGLPTGFQYDEWHTLTITLDGSNFTYEVGDLSLTLPSNGDAYFEAVFLQGYNTHTDYSSGVTYETYWDNLVNSSAPAAVDNCDPSPVVTGTRSDSQDLNDPYPVGTTTITWEAEDACGNITTEQQVVEVLGDSLMNVEVDLEGVNSGDFDRCIEFELTDSGGNIVEVVSQVLNFVNGTATATIEVPCGDYGACITARDSLHTLRSTGDLSIDGTEYVASNIDQLIGGDLNDDGFVDILDFGVYVWQYSEDYGTANTTCGTSYPHADITGDGLVTAADFTYIQQNFLESDDVCPVTVNGSLKGHRTKLRGRTSVSVRELHRMQLSELATADMNGDGVVDQTDIALFLNGKKH